MILKEQGIFENINFMIHKNVKQEQLIINTVILLSHKRLVQPKQ